MRTLAIGISPLIGGRSGPPQPAVLLSSAGQFPENIASGAALGTLSVVNVTGTPTYTLTNSDGTRVALTGANLTRGAAAWDYETHPLVTFTVSVTGTTPVIANRTFTLDVTNVLETILAALGLSPSTVAEGAAAGTVVGAITGKTSGSSLSLTDDAGGRFAISGTNLIAGTTPTDYETSTLHAITIRETHPDAAPRDTALAVTVTNVAEATLAALTLSASTVAENATIGTVVGAVVGQTSGSTLSLTGTAGGLFALSGTNIVTAGALDYETATSHSITIRETYAEASNSPRDTVRTITVTDVVEASFGPFTLTWTSADTELTNLAFSITPALLENDSATIAIDNNSDCLSPFTTSAANTIDAAEAAAGSITFTGLTLPLPAAQTYAQVTVTRSGFANVKSSIAPKLLVATDTTAPVLSSPTGTKTGQTTATLTVTTDEANGTLYGVNSAAAPSKAQIKAGQTSTGAASSYAFNQAVTAPGVQTKNATGLTAATSYTMHYMHEDTAGNQSNVASASAFTTDAAGGTVVFDAASQKSDGGGVTTQTWTHTPVGTPTGVVVAMAYWQGALTTPTAVTYGGVAMTLESSADNVSAIRLYSLANPPPGAQTVSITWSATAYPTAGAITVTGGSTTDVLRVPPTARTGVSDVPGSGITSDTLTVTSAANELVVDALFAYDTGLTPSAGQTTRVNPASIGNQMFRMSTKAGAASVAMTWTFATGADSCAFGHVGGSFNP